VGGGAGGGAQDAGLRNVFAEQGICDTDGCVRGWYLKTSVVMFTHVDVPILPPPGPTEAWRGGVVLIDGRILLTADTATEFLLVDLKGPSVSYVHPIAGSGERAFGASVLGCDGRAYALPNEEADIVRFVPDGNGGLTWVRLPWLPPAVPIQGITGAVVSGPCDNGVVPITAAGAGAWFYLEISEEGVTKTVVTPLGPQPQLGEPQGVVRTDSLPWVLPAPNCFTVSSPIFPMQACTAEPSGGEYLGAAFTSLDSAILVFNSDAGVAETWSATTLTLHASASVPLGSGHWPLARTDGFVYGATPELRAVIQTLDAGGDLPVCVDCDAGFPGSVGLVNALNGSIVAVPAAGTNVVRVFLPVPLPDGGPPVPDPRALLSSYLNKL
jgi:hypothetical protein